MFSAAYWRQLCPELHVDDQSYQETREAQGRLKRVVKGGQGWPRVAKEQPSLATAHAICFS